MVTNEMLEMENFDPERLGKVIPPSYYQTIRDTLKAIRSQSSRADDEGYLMIVKGGKPENAKYFYTFFLHIIILIYTLLYKSKPNRFYYTNIIFKGFA